MEGEEINLLPKYSFICSSINISVFVLSYYVSLHSEFSVVMFATISA